MTIPTRSPQRSRGVVLLVCLVMILLISVSAAMTVRGAVSAEATTNASRKEALAMQAAEAALGHCERETHRFVVDSSQGLAPANAGTDRWKDLRNWDGASSTAYVTIASFAQGDLGVGASIFRRMPECMTEYRDADKKQVIVTARGFGPEVRSVDSSRAAPRGTEIWLQSIISLQ